MSKLLIHDTFADDVHASVAGSCGSGCRVYRLMAASVSSKSGRDTDMEAFGSDYSCCKIQGFRLDAPSAQCSFECSDRGIDTVIELIEA
jgi:hypothetical protein